MKFPQSIVISLVIFDNTVVFRNWVVYLQEDCEPNIYSCITCPNIRETKIPACWQRDFVNFSCAQTICSHP